jgi:integrase
VPARSNGHSTDTKPKITDRLVAKLQPPGKGSRILYDTEVRGFGVRLTAGGTVSFVLNYRLHGRERRCTIGRYPEISALAARDEAIKLRGAIRNGLDPLAEQARVRSALTLKEFAEKYLRDHAEPNKRPRSVREDKRLLDAIIVPSLGKLALGAITRPDIEALRREFAATPVQANRVLSLLHTLFELAKEWNEVENGFSNPAHGIQRYHEEPRKRWLQGGELKRLLETLDRQEDQEAANAFRLMLLTGSRKGETLSAKWEQIDFERGSWTKPSHATKQEKTETIPLSPPALALLKKMARSKSGEYLFPGKKDGNHRQDVKNLWATVRKQAEIADVRPHDLRHTFASHLVSDGASLTLVGALLGHTQPHTTQRYAHLADHALRNVTNQFGKVYEKSQKRPKRKGGR